MRNFLETLELEIKRQETLLRRALTSLETAPKGHLNIKERKMTVSYYWEIEDRQGKKKFRKQININHDKKMILDLAQKQLMRLCRRRASFNLKYLKLLRINYLSVDDSALMAALCGKYKKIFDMRKEMMIKKQMDAPYPKAAFDPRYHTHETDCGIFVRSKSEQILANALYAYGIPFHYEREFLYEKGNGGRIFPDFTIYLPDGKIIIWEHLGLLSNENYCLQNARKLNIYQMNGFTIGENLILTMDDSNQNFSSAVIHKIIREQILSHFESLEKIPFR